MVFPDYEVTQELAKTYNSIPLALRATFPEGFDLLHLLKQENPSLTDAVLLESGRSGRYSYLAYKPVAAISSKKQVTTIRRSNGDVTTETDVNPLEVLRRFMQDYHVPRIEGLPDFSGGAAGYLSYDMNAYFESTLPHIANDDLQLPEFYVMVYEDLLIIDHKTRELISLTHLPAESLSKEAYDLAAKRLVERIQRAASRGVAAEDCTDWDELRKSSLTMDKAREVSFTQTEFEQAVRKVQHYIAQGDVFQVNLSVRQSHPIHVDAVDVYEVLRRLNPSPYMGYLHFSEFQLVSGSPELLIKVKAGEVSTRPIAGTRPRGMNREEDLALAKDLIENDKERAEHVMLVDLERNDLGRVCRYGSVEVSEFMTIEEYSHVMHIVSHVRGILADGKDAYDAVAAAFPGGTITGAPKVRTMEIIEELEPVKRGVYTGSIGWFGFNGDVELNIAIRTMVVKDGIAHVQAGAGIVIDSHPQAEYFESLKKAEALWKALELGEKRRLSKV
jgi:para-aminobenzoate synthetase component 1